MTLAAIHATVERAEAAEKDNHVFMALGDLRLLLDIAEAAAEYRRYDASAPGSYQFRDKLDAALARLDAEQDR